MIEDKNGKEVSTSTRGTLKKKEILRDENDKHVRTSIGEQFKNKEMFRDEKGKRVLTYTDGVSTVKLVMRGRSNSLK